jgi:hypothetical protein
MARLGALVLALAAAACTDAAAPANNPTPGIASLAPAVAEAGSGEVKVQIVGSDFVKRSVVRWNGADLPTRYVASSQLEATIPASDLAQQQDAQVTVFNPAPGGGTSNIVTFAVRNPSYPVPVLASISPAFVAAGSPGATLTLIGTGFTPASRVFTGAAERPAQYVSATQLTVTLTAAEVAAAGTLPFTVTNPFPGGGISSAVLFEIRAPVPAITSLGQTTAIAGEPSLELAVNGTGFTANSEVRFNGSARPTTLTAPGQLTTTLASGDLQAAGTYPITVVNPAPGGGTSNAANLTLVNGVPAISLLPAYGASAGRTGFTLTVHGTRFVNGAVVRWNGSDRPTTYLSPTRVSASISAADVASAGTAQITVANPAPGGGTSGAQAMTIRAVAAPAITDLKTVSLPVQDVAWSAASGRLYASLPGTAAQYPNSVAAIDPASGAVTGSVFVGSDPSFLALAGDQSQLYVALDGSSTVRRVSVPSLTAGLEFSTGRVEEMEAMPGAPSTVAISLMNPGTSPRHLGVCLYDDGVKRSRCTQGHTGSNSIEFGDSAGVLYGYNNETTEFGFRTIGVLPDGLQELRVTFGLIGGFYARIHYASGRVYSDNGAVIDGGRHLRVGTFDLGISTAGFVLPDTALGRAFAIDDSGVLSAWDMNTFTLLGSVTIPGFTADHPALRRVRIVRWGSDGLAVSDGHALFIFRTTLAAP